MASNRNKLLDVMAARCEWLKKLAEIREYDLAYKNNDFLCIYFNSLCVAYNRQDAKNMLREMNRKLNNPLSNESVENIIEKINMKSLYHYKNETIIQRLAITENEVEQLGIYAYQKKMERIEENKKKKKELKAAVFEDKANGMKNKDIYAKYCTGDYPKRTTVETWLREYADSPECKAKIIELHTQKISEVDIKKITGYHIAKIRAAIREYEKTQKIANIGSTMIMKESFTTKEDIALTGTSLYKTELKVSSVSDYQLALSKLKGTKDNVFLYGNAGSGKSHAIKEWIASLDDEQIKKVTIVAPTGRAAEILNGNTIHSVFKFPLGVLPKPDVDNMIIPTALENTEILIIDEVSMCRVDVFENIIQTIRLIEQTYNRTIKIVCVGDFGQLEPTVTKEDKKLLKQWYQGSVYAFQSELWQQCNFQKIKLTYVFRQEDSSFGENLNAIKYGAIEAIDYFNKNAAFLPDLKAIYITSRKVDAIKHNQEEISKFKKSQLKTYKAKCKADVSDEELPMESELTLAVGMRVICTCNDCEGLYTNGSLGTVTQLLNNAVMVLLDNGNEAKIKYKVFKLPSGAVWLMLPLSYGYAITVQRSQGCTFDYVAIDSGESGFFSVGALYVALSRCTSISGLYLETPIRNKELKINIDALRMTL